MANSQCMYCGGAGYGRPCLFSPTNTHAHLDNPGKCIYCGSTYQGSGCLFNPYGKMHVRGMDFLNMAAIKTEKTAVLSYILDRVRSETLNENFYTSPLDRFYKRLAGILATVSQPLLEALSLSQNSPKTDKVSTIKAFEYKQEFKSALKVLNESIKNANLELPPETVEKALIEAIIDSQNGLF